MLKVALIPAALTVPLLTGCASFPPASSEVVSASAVIDTLKAELAASAVTAHPTIAEGGLCGNLEKKVVIIAVPASATVSLKTVATTATSGSVGATIPVLGQSLGPSFIYTQTRAVTQVITFDLNVVHAPKTEGDLTEEVRMRRARIDADNAELKDLVGPKKITDAQAEFLKEQIRTDTATVLEDEAALVTLHTSPGYNSPTPAVISPDAKRVLQPLQSHTETLKTDLSISAAISAAIQELLNVNHNLLPCLKPQTVKVEVDFDVQKKKDGSISLTVVIWKFGTERVATSQNFHSILVTFDMTQGSSTLIP